MGSVEVLGGETCRVELIADSDFSYALAEEETPQLIVNGPGFVYAPAVEGADAGFAYVLIEGKSIGKVPLIYGQTVEQKKTEEKNIWQSITERLSKGGG